jgi:hypothetical protein
MYKGCRTFSGHPPCWSRSLSPHMGGRSHPCATKASPESPLRDAGTVPCGAETPRGRSHPCTPLVAVTADRSPMRQTPSPTVPLMNVGREPMKARKGKEKRERVLVGRRLDYFCFCNCSIKSSMMKIRPFPIIKTGKYGRFSSPTYITSPSVHMSSLPSRTF